MNIEKIKAERNRNYMTVANYIARDGRVSLKARGLFFTIMSLPDNWALSIEGLQKILNDGEASIRTAFKQLEDLGYCVRQRLRDDETGKFTAVEYTFLEQPKQTQANAPQLDFPVVDNPALGNPAQLNSSKNEELNGSTPIPPEGANSASASPLAVDAVKQIFDFWLQTMSKSKATKLDRSRRAKIEARLREGYTVAEIKSAIKGCHASAYHMGDNIDGKKYNDLTLICRTGSKLEQFAEMAPAQAPKPGRAAWLAIVSIQMADEVRCRSLDDYRISKENYLALYPDEREECLEEIREYEASEAFQNRFQEEFPWYGRTEPNVDITDNP